MQTEIMQNCNQYSLIFISLQGQITHHLRNCPRYIAIGHQYCIPKYLKEKLNYVN